MNLVADIGNNFFKLGIFKNSNLIFSFSDKNEKIDIEIEKIICKYKDLNSALISNVSSIKINDLKTNYVYGFKISQIK